MRISLWKHCLSSSLFPSASTPKTQALSPVLLIIAFLLVGLVAGGLIGYTVTYSDFNTKLTNLQSQIGLYQGSGTNGTQQTYLINDTISLSNLYQQVKSSVVVIQDLVPQYSFFGNLAGYSQQQGSGFITSVNNQLVIVTNNHVIQDALNETVTFSNGQSYPATVLGSDPKADLAVLSISPMPSGLTPLTLASSDTLQVGDPVVAVGSPYGLSGTLTTGVISATGRTITEDSSTNQNGQTIADIIQTSTAINPGNSGGPLFTYTGDVVGITTAGISNSQGLGFAIPSGTIIREISFACHFRLIQSASLNKRRWNRHELPNRPSHGHHHNLWLSRRKRLHTKRIARRQHSKNNLRLINHLRRRHHNRHKQPTNNQHRRPTQLLRTTHSTRTNHKFHSNKKRTTTNRAGYNRKSLAMTI